MCACVIYLHYILLKDKIFTNNSSIILISVFLYSQFVKMVIYILSVWIKLFHRKKFHIIFFYVGSYACKNHKRAYLCLMIIMSLISFKLISICQLSKNFFRSRGIWRHNSLICIFREVLFIFISKHIISAYRLNNFGANKKSKTGLEILSLVFYVHACDSRFISIHCVIWNTNVILKTE